MRIVKGLLTVLALAGLSLAEPVFAVEEDTPLPSVGFIKADKPIADADEEKGSVQEAMVAELVKETVEKEVGRMAGETVFEWEILETKLPDSSRLPASFDDLTVTPAKRGMRGNRLLLRLKFFNNGKLIKRLNATVRIEAFADVVVSNGTLERGTMLLSDMVSLERKAVNLPLTSFCTEVARVNGQVANRRIVSGQMIRKSEISRPPDVKAGDIVMIVAEKVNVRITARGIAREDGAVGEMIAVTNTRSNKKVFARVTGGSAVQVVF